MMLNRLRTLRSLVTACGLTTLVLTINSAWFEPGVYVGYVASGGERFRTLEATLSDGYLTETYHPNRSHGHWSTQPDGWDLALVRGQPFPPNTRHWFAPPAVYRSGGSDGPSTRGELPMIYPVLLLVGWSAWLFMFRKSVAGRCCARCGYDLAALPSSTCPECGHRATPA